MRLIHFLLPLCLASCGAHGGAIESLQNAFSDVVRPQPRDVSLLSAAAGLLAIVNPLLALIPLIEPGTAPESNCAQLLNEAKAAK
jgi:hypothetical protein